MNGNSLKNLKVSGMPKILASVVSHQMGKVRKYLAISIFSNFVRLEILKSSSIGFVVEVKLDWYCYWAGNALVSSNQLGLQFGQVGQVEIQILNFFTRK